MDGKQETKHWINVFVLWCPGARAQRRNGMLQSTENRLERVANISFETHHRAAKTTSDHSQVVNALVGGMAGGLLGLLGGLLVISGLLPGLAAFAAFGLTLPLLVGVCLGGVGTLVGSFVELLPINNGWRDPINKL
jgi:hypothetical protein